MERKYKILLCMNIIFIALAFLFTFWLMKNEIDMFTALIGYLALLLLWFMQLWIVEETEKIGVIYE